MFNIKNRIYVQDISQLDTSYKFILIDNLLYNDVNFQESNGTSEGLLYKGNSLQHLLDTHFSGSIYSFYLFLKDQDKLRIYVDSKDDYNTLFIYTFIEMLTTLSLLTDTVFINNFLEKKEISRLISANDDIDYRALFSTLITSYTGSGQLYTLSQIEEFPLECIIQSYQNNTITKVQADLKIATLSGLILRAFLEGLLPKISVLLYRYPIILRTLLSDINIVNPSLVNEAIKTNVFLTKIILNNNVDIVNDLVQFTDLINVIFTYDPDPDEGADVSDLILYTQLYQTNDIDLFISNSNIIVSSIFFMRNPNKINNLLVYTNYGV